MNIFKVAMQRLVDAWKLSAREISLGFQMALVRAGWRPKVRSMQVVLDYPKPGPRRSRFTGIAAMRRQARKERNRRHAA